MAENEQAEAPVKTEVTTNENQSEQITTTVADAQKPVDTGPTPESLKVSQAQFDKYFSKDTGQYNWEAHAREQEFIDKQKADDKDTEGTEDKPEEKAEAKDDENKYAEITDENAPTAVKEAGLDLDALKAKVFDNGDIDDADYEALKKIGVDEKAANAYVQNLFDTAQGHLDTVMDMFGGQDGLKATMEKLVEAGTVDKDDLEGLAFSLGDPRTGVSVAKTLLAQAGGKPAAPANRLRGDQGGGSQETDGFKSQSEMVTAQRDPRYKTDEAYRNEVIAKIAKSTFGDNSSSHTSGL
jgi:hypothetical protein